MKKVYAFLFCLCLFFCACKKETQLQHATNVHLFSRVEMDEQIKKEIRMHQAFDWNASSDDFIWSALENADHILSIGFSIDQQFNMEDNIHQIDIQQPEWKKAKDQLIQLALSSEQRLDKSLTLQKIMPWDEFVLPVVNLVIKNPATIQLLRSNPMVRYVEPMGYEPNLLQTNSMKNPSQTSANSSSGCGSNNAELGLTLNNDYTFISPASMQSWNYAYHQIPKAWAKSTGKGIKVFIIDTGCELDQENLGTAFNQGQSTGRTIEKIVTLPRASFLGIPTGPIETPDDDCGHGTSMAGACAAPRGVDGNANGVAYNCNLITCRAAEGVFIENSREAKGVADAFTNAANRLDVKIISMSLGRITTSSQIKDAILYAYGKGKLIFCAAGTSFSWTSSWVGVIFPATLPQVNAVTGVKTTDYNTSCTDCHDGSETDFTVVMEKPDYKSFPLTVAMRGDVPSIVGGSSVATATTAGMAALVWSRFPSYTRDQVLNKLMLSSQYYPTRNANLGWGMINADAATN